MCGPAAIPIAALVVAAAGTAMSAVAMKRQSEAQNAANEYNAQMDERNAKLAEQQARDVEATGQPEEAKLRRDLQKVKASQRASMAGAGVLVDSGSAEDLALDTTKFGEIDALTLRNNVAKQAWGVRVQAQNYAADAGLQRSQRQNPYLASGGTLLSGASSALSQFRASTAKS